MLVHLLIASVLASNASGKTLVRAQPGTMVPATSSQRTNYVLNPNSFCSVSNDTDTSWSFFSNTCLNSQRLAPDGVSRADSATSSANNGGPYQAVTVPLSSIFMEQVWAAKVTGTGIVSMVFRCTGGTPTSCSCTRNDGGACTSGTGTPGAATDCWVKASVGTDWVRLRLNLTCSAALTNPLYAIYPGELGTSTGTALLWGSRVEIR